MENWGKWKLIKIGFFLGIGFIIPELFVMASSTAISIFAMPSMMEASMDFDDENFTSNFGADFDRADQIEIRDQREQASGDQLLILGSIQNTGDKKASSIQLEAELMDKDGTFVYECSEYIDRDLMPGDIENYQIKCGCGDNSVPEYAEVSVRVVSASGY